MTQDNFEETNAELPPEENSKMYKPFRSIHAALSKQMDISDTVKPAEPRVYSLEELNLTKLVFDNHNVWADYNNNTWIITDLIVKPGTEEIENGIENKEHKKLIFPVWNIEGIVKGTNYTIRDSEKEIVKDANYTLKDNSKEILHENADGIIERTKDIAKQNIKGRFKGTIRPKIMILTDGKLTRRILPNDTPELAFYIFEDRGKCYLGKSMGYYSSEGDTLKELKCKMGTINPNEINSFSPIFDIFNSEIKNACTFYTNISPNVVQVKNGLKE